MSTKVKSVKWQSPSNIAIVKYWGKVPVQLPMNPSVSFSLTNSRTETEIQYWPKECNDLVSAEFYFEGERKPEFEKRIIKFFMQVKDAFNLFEKYHLRIDSKNTFPHSAGIASSASAMSALALCLVSIEQELTHFDDTDLKQKASVLARIGSGSASRSVYGGFILWGECVYFPQSSKEYSIPISENIHPAFKDLQDTILIVKSAEKTVSSSAGHDLMEDHPYRIARVNQAKKNTESLINALQNGDFDTFIRICEQEAMSLHAMMMTSTPSFVLIEPESLQIIEKIKKLRAKTNAKVCFTLDAGPNIHLIYPLEEKERIMRFVKDELLVLCERQFYIDDYIGDGPNKI
jgi:diphosphomevalonate decarboxylase